MIAAVLILLNVAGAAEVSIQATCLNAKVENGDVLTVVAPCRNADVPLEDTAWTIDADATNLPVRDGGSFSRFTVYRENESYELTTSGAPTPADLRKRKFKLLNETEGCMHRTRYTLAKTGVSRPPKVNVKEEFKKISR